MGWVALIVFSNRFDKNRSVTDILCYSNSFDKVLDYVLTYPTLDCLKEWQKAYSTQLSEYHKELLDKMRTGKINGVNIVFDNCDTYVDFKNIPEV